MRPPVWTIRCCMIGVGVMAGTFQTVFQVDCALAANIKLLAGFIIGLLAQFVWTPEKKT
jgi:uncharacterized membrane protein YjjP (DUF1212 family)